MIAIIAGKGRLPIYACQSLLFKQKSFFVIVLFPADNFEQLQVTVGSQIKLISQPFYKVGSILQTLKENFTRQILFIGKVDKQHLLSHVKFDWLAIKLLTSMLYKNDSAIMEYLIQELAKHSIEVISQADVLDALIVPPGVLSGNMTPELEHSISMGINTAIKLSECDIGQTVIVKDNMIIAVEAIEGTDNCIKRGIELGKNNIVICKAARSNQNKKFDLPALGPHALENLQLGQVAAVAWLSSQTLIADQDDFIKKAQSLKITLVSYAPNSK
jgi:DUF1009 family protein